MIFPQTMLRLTAVILQKDADHVTRSLLNAGIIDFMNARSQEFPLSRHLSALHQQTAGADITDLRERMERLMVQADLPLPSAEQLNADELEFVDPKTVTAKLEMLAVEVQKIREQQKLIQQQLNRKAEIRRQVRLFENIASVSTSESAVALSCGVLRRSRMDGFVGALSLYPVVIRSSSEPSEDEIGTMLLYMKRDEQQISPILDRFQWQTVAFPADLSGTRDEIIDHLNRDITTLEEEQESLRRQALAVITDHEPWLMDTWNNLTITRHYVQIQDRFGKTAETVLFTGWVPRKQRDRVEQRIRDATEGNCYTEWTRPEDDPTVNRATIPVQLEHHGLLKPFQWIVENYAMPQYGSVDPTLIVAISYLAMFGLMFGDAGHGLVIALVGASTAWIGRHRKATAWNLGRLLLWCGCASIGTGILFGSYFGYSAFPPLWFDYHGIVMGHSSPGLIQDIYDILGITIYFGIAIIACGIILNLINHLRSGRYGDLLFDKGGLLGGWFYAGGVYTAIFFVRSGYREFPHWTILLITLMLPSLLFFFKPLFHFVEKRRAGKAVFRPMLLLDWIMDWVVELLELFSGYLSNTLSFMRIAGLGVAHVSLMTAFFQLADRADSAIASVIILILGNALVIALEGLSAAIQSLRLNYYEFFSRYFHGSGKAYAPISLRRSA